MMDAAFICEKTPAIAARGMVVTNHPLASSAGAEMLLAGGNAVDAAIASLFALTVVEPMMVGILGGGLSHIRMADGRHVVIDGISTAPAAAHGAMYETRSNSLVDYRETAGRKNLVGALAVAVPGALLAWCHALETYGTLPLEDVLRPAISLARHGFVTTPYLTDCISDTLSDIAADSGLARRFLKDGAAIPASTRQLSADYAETLAMIAREGPKALTHGALGQALIAHLSGLGGIMTADDLKRFKVIERQPIRGTYRGYDVYGAPPPSSAGVHVTQMLNLLEHYDIKALGFGTAKATHLMSEVMKIAFADRAVATADPAFVDVPVDLLTSKAYAQKRAGDIDPAKTQVWGPGLSTAESADTTHVTVADQFGNVVAATQTINGLFGACVEVPGTGMIANNYMYNFDPHPGLALSIAPGKRVFTSMAPTIVTRDGALAFALGLPGGLRIFPSALQGIVNMIDHGMSPQQAVEAPRLWTEGGVVELEPGFPADIDAMLESFGHKVQRVRRVAGGMGLIAFHADASMTGASCWRADGTPVGIAGGLAKAGIRFSAV
jgi:gamma-glutamyltranspeptidase / glutathione hydrolase